ncbi:glycosyltransferase family 2 protein [Candidatus Uhrbacteria bacterium]|nr:glycosyltransferase family 2 protein [Candidatus Uhrbacteria bacterium]
MKYLPALMASVRGQTLRDFTVLVIDNASSDGAIEFLRAQYPEVTILRNAKNLGFSGAHNQGIRYALAAWRDAPRTLRYVLVTNPDIIFTPTFLEKMVAAADAHTDGAVFGGKLLKVLRQGEGPLAETIETKIIDSTGLRMARSRRTTDRGAGEEDRGQYDAAHEIFGVSGALACYRASALEAVRIGEEYFDNDFFAYKEDADIAWRLRLHGFRAYYIPQALAYHFRRAYGRERAGLRELIRNRRAKSGLVNYLSYRNHLLMLVKNEQWANILLHLPWIVVYECGKLVSLLLFEPRTLRALGSFLRLVPRILVKRRTVMAKCRVRAREIRRWFA